MKKAYEIMALIGILMFSADCSNIVWFIIWHLAWFVVVLLCIKKADMVKD